VSGDGRGDTPEQVLDRFVTALNDGDLRSVRDAFARDGCFVTPDATVIHGREHVGAALAQFVSIGFRVQLQLRSAVAASDVALLSDRWTTALRAESHAELRQTCRASTLLRHLEGQWKILLLAPWGWAVEESGFQPPMALAAR
jgi:uncharacterized protein (TIGR02246 family)